MNKQIRTHYITLRVSPQEKSLIDGLGSGKRSSKSKVLRGILLNAALELDQNQISSRPAQFPTQLVESMNPAGAH